MKLIKSNKWKLLFTSIGFTICAISFASTNFTGGSISDTANWDNNFPSEGNNGTIAVDGLFNDFNLGSVNASVTHSAGSLIPGDSTPVWQNLTYTIKNTGSINNMHVFNIGTNCIFNLKDGGSVNFVSTGGARFNLSGAGAVLNITGGAVNGTGNFQIRANAADTTANLSGSTVANTSGKMDWFWAEGAGSEINISGSFSVSAFYRDPFAHTKTRNGKVVFHTTWIGYFPVPASYGGGTDWASCMESANVYINDRGTELKVVASGGDGTTTATFSDYFTVDGSETLTLTNPVEVLQSVAGNSIKDTTNNADYIDTPYAGVGGNLSRTHEFWLKPDASGARQGVLREGSDAGNYKRVDIRIETSGALRVELAGTGKTSGTGVVEYGKWQHVAITLTTNGSGADLIIYVNGTPVTTHTFATLTTDTAQNINLLGVINTIGAPKELEMDEYRYWDVALTEAQIQKLMTDTIKNNAGAVELNSSSTSVTGLNWSNLQLYYKFNDDLTDSSANGRDASQAGTATTYQPSGALPYTAVQETITIDGNNNPNFSWSFDGATTAPTGYKVIIASDANFATIIDTDDVGNVTSYVHDNSPALGDGIYYAKVVSYDGSATDVAESNVQSFDYTLTPALGLDIIVEGGYIKWSVESEVDVKEYVIVNKTTSEIIATVSAGESNYAVVLPEGTDDAILKVVDNSGYTQTFTTNPQTEIIIDLISGWNLLSLPFDSETLTSDVVWIWSNNSQSYEEAENVQALQGFWFYSNDAAAIEFSGEATDAAFETQPGWNLVGPSENMDAPNDKIVFGWDKAYLQTGIMTVGNGYWIYSEK